MAILKGKEVNEAELGFLLGLQLLQVCIGANEVILNFDGYVSITVESRITFSDASGLNTVYAHLPSAGVSLVKLLSSNIDRMAFEQDGTLSLHFGTGDTLSLHKDSGPFESYHVKHAHEVYVV
jgi:hypothetical protein